MPNQIYFDGEKLHELKEPAAKYYCRFDTLIGYIRKIDDADINAKALAINLLLDVLLETGVCNELIRPKNIKEFIQVVTDIFVMPSLPDLTNLTDLLDDLPPPEFIQTSGNVEARYLVNLAGIYDAPTALEYWNTLPRSTIEAIIFEASQSLLLNNLKDKLTPEALNTRKASKALQQKIIDGTAMQWIHQQIRRHQDKESHDLAMEQINEISL